MNLPCAVEHDLGVHYRQESKDDKFDAIFDAFLQLSIDEVEDGEHDKDLFDEFVEAGDNDTKKQIVERLAKRIAKQKMEREQ